MSPYCEQPPLSSSIIFITSKWSAIQSNERLPFLNLMKGWIWRGRCFRPQWVRLHRWSMQVKQLSSPPCIWNVFNMYPSHEIDSERLWQREINQGRRVSSWTWGSEQLYLQKTTVIICFLCTIHPISLEQANSGKVVLLPIMLSKTYI